MKVLAIHTYYQQPGGEDEVFAAETALLREKGHEVHTLVFHNRDLKGLPPWRQSALTLWNGGAYRQVREVIRDIRPHLVHMHNTFPLASPAIIRAAKAEGVPVVMTLHNYRLLCVDALFLREGCVCEACLGRLPWRGALYGCYRGNRAMSGVVAAMLILHRVFGTYEKVERFIALTEFARGKFVEGGIPSEKIAIKPNFVYPDPAPGEGQGRYALFVGRLSREKGVGTLLDAWKQLAANLPLKIIGDGPLASEVSKFSELTAGVEYLGRQPNDKVLDLMREAFVLVFPSVWYEGFPRVIVEAFSVGLPVLASNLGSMSSLSIDGQAGLLFNPGDVQDLYTKAAWLIANPDTVFKMRYLARAMYEVEYTAERNYQLLIEIYERAMRTSDE